MGEFVKIAKTSDVAEGAAGCYEVGDKVIAVFNVGGELLAVDDECPHAGGSLSEGYLEGGEIECPWHAECFNLKTGEPSGELTQDPVACYKVRVVGEDIEVEV